MIRPDRSGGLRLFKNKCSLWQILSLEIFPLTETVLPCRPVPRFYVNLILAMKKIKQIEKYINRAMCVDRPFLRRALRRLKKDMVENGAAVKNTDGKKTAEPDRTLRHSKRINTVKADKERTNTAKVKRAENNTVKSNKENVYAAKGEKSSPDNVKAKYHGVNTRFGYEKRILKLKKQVLRSVSKRENRKKNLPKIFYDKSLPITAKREDIIDTIKKNKVVIISGATGSGKTTQIPKFCIEAGRGIAGRIGCTQPRRIAAVNVAMRIAEELKENIGDSVGYKIRFDKRFLGDPFIKIMTDGILLAETQNDPFLNEYDTIIVDEAHERSLNIDFILGMLRRLIKKRRDLKIIITSATIDTEKFSLAFDKAPVIEVSGRMYPVELRYVSFDKPDVVGDGPYFGYGSGLDTGFDSISVNDDQGYVEAATAAVDLVCRQSRYGDILIFMPTEQDIFDTIELIRGRDHKGVTVLPLFARLSSKEQAMVFSSGPGRKIVVSTNVAETSLTIPGIRYVIDSGLARIPHYSPRTRTTALPVKAISQSSADQRKGRCGRVANGICIRLYDEDDYGARPLFTPPEILRSNLSEVILRMISLNLGDVALFPFIDPPSFKSIKDGFDTLLELGAIKKAAPARSGKHNGGSGKARYVLTRDGRIMAGIPVDPKLSRILIEADRTGCLDEALVIVSALSIADPRQRPRDNAQVADEKHRIFSDPSSDFITLLNIWKAYKRAEKSLKTRSLLKKFCRDNFFSFKRMREWQDIHRQIGAVLAEHGIKGEKKIVCEIGTKGLKAKQYEIGGPFYTALHKAFLCGYLANIARKKEKNVFNAAKGQKVTIFPGSALFGKAGTWIVAGEFVETSQTFARTVANIDPGWLEELGKKLCTYTWSSPHWEKKRGEVVADEQVSLFGLVIVEQRSVSYGKINPKEAGEIFIRDALVQGDIVHKFPFMTHNQAIIDELKQLEDKTRRRDILATDEDIFLFYRERLERDFYDIRTFAKYLKNKKDDSFLRMNIEYLRKKTVGEDEISKFPDFIDTAAGRLELEYDFKPGGENDGVTVKIPAPAVPLVHPCTVDRLVPGLFKEKIEALIKDLPKKYRVQLVPVSMKADIIANEMYNAGESLFVELSSFVKKRFNAEVPVSAWSDNNLDDHLKMRISIINGTGEEIAVSREKSLLKEFSQTGMPFDEAFEKKKKLIEKDNILSWNFGDINTPVLIETGNNLSYRIFPGLVYRDGKIGLRLFRTEREAEKFHVQGVMHLYFTCYPDDFTALKKDIKTSECVRKYARIFRGTEKFSNALFCSVSRELFAKNIRKKDEFYRYGRKIIPFLYEKGQGFLSIVSDVCDKFINTFNRIENISLKNLNRPSVMHLMTVLEKELSSLVPENFPDIYESDDMVKIARYVEAIGIRAERGASEPAKDAKKAEKIKPYKQKLDNLLEELSPDASGEKAEALENFFWMIEEYKISVFAQELKTSIKISPKKLDAMCSFIENMI